MDNFYELDEPVISSSGRKRKITAETFSQNLAKAACYNGEGKKLRVLCVITSIQSMIATTTMFVRHLHCHVRRLQRLNECFFFYSKTGNVELTAFAIKPTFNM